MNSRIAVFVGFLIVAAGAGGVVYAQSSSPARTPAVESAEPANNEGAENSEVSPTARPSVRPTGSDAQKEDAVEELKEKIETKVSELKDRNLQTKAGYVISIKENTLTVRTETGEIKVELDPDVTEVFRIDGSRTAELETDDISKEDYILVVGPEIGSTVTANRIYIDEQFIVRAGTIIEVNPESFYIRVQTIEKEIYTLDIERSTNQQMLEIKTLELSKVGFTKLKEGDAIHFTASRGIDRTKTRFSAQSTIIVPQEYFIKE